MKIKKMSLNLIKNCFYTLIFCGFSFSAFALNFHTSLFKDTKNQKSVFTFFVPNGKIDAIEISLSGSISQSKAIRLDHSLKNIKSKLGPSMNKIMESLDIKTEEEFASKVQNFDESLVFLSVFDKSLGELLGTRYIMPIDNSASGNATVSIKLFLNGRQVDASNQTLNLEEYPVVEIPQITKIDSYDKAAQVFFKKSNDENVVAYNIYYSENEFGTYKKHNQKPITVFSSGSTNSASSYIASYMLTELKNGNKYFVQVKSIHLNSTESEPSKTFEVIPADDNVLPPPEILKIEQKQNQIIATVHWDKSGEKQPQFFHIYRAEALTGPYKRITKAAIPGAIRTYEDAGPFEYGKTYWYRMTAMGKALKEGPSGAAVYYQPKKTIPPTKVKINRIDVKPGELMLTIIPLNDPTIKTYEIFRANNSSSEPAMIGSLKNNEKTYADKGLDARALYCYVVRARDSYGNLGENNKPLCATPKNNKVLPEPFNVHGYMDQGGVMLEWKYNETQLLIGFHVYKSDAKKRNFKRLNKDLLSKGSRNFVDVEALPGQTYSYYIIPIGLNQLPGQKSNIINVEVRQGAILPIYNIKYFKSNNSILITWNAISDAASYQVKIIPSGQKKAVAAGNTKETNFTWRNPQKNAFYVEITAKTKKNQYRGTKQIYVE